MDTAALRRRLESDLALTERDLSAVRGRLAVGQAESGGELSLVDQHPADAATETEQRELDTAERRMLEGRVARIKAALGRMESGTYGRCVVGGEAIDEERLEALPDTPFCIKHASTR